MTDKAILLIFVFFAAVFPALADATVEFKTEGSTFIFDVFFEKGQSNINVLSDGKQIVLSFDTTEAIKADRIGEIGMLEDGINGVRLVTDGSRKSFYFSFENDKVIEPRSTMYNFDGRVTNLTSGEQIRTIRLEFPLNAATSTALAPSLPGAGAWVKMFSGLFLILLIIFAAYAAMRYFFKHNVVTDIPGIGRLLGKVDLDIKKSLIFYELGEIIYILGVTDGGISTVDKITDPVDVNLVKAGFSRRKNFSSYMKFFRKRNEIKDDMTDSKDILEEKLSSLRKK